MMKRRQFVEVVSGSLLAIPGAAKAQARHTSRIGMLLFNAPASEPIGPLLDGLKDAGYAIDRNLAIDYRFAEGQHERLPALATELAQLHPDVIFALGGDVAPYAKAATTTIPIVAWVSNDPVKSGLVADMGRPGGNVTGITLIYDELAGKTLGFLKEAAPSMTRVAVLWNPEHADPEFQETKRAADVLKIRLQSLEVRRPDDFAGAYKAALAERAEGLVIVFSRLMSRERPRILEFAAKNQILVAGGFGEWTRDGALLSYGPNPVETMQRVAVFVTKILKGARPADLPMERPTRFELVLNLGTARTFGLTLPPNLLARAGRLV
jgi:putative tryptophan/tyrosine transport system substrate-binding protein